LSRGAGYTIARRRALARLFEALRMIPADRPLSPHLQIYKPQLTSVLSITHRACGVALSVGSVFLVWWLVAAASGSTSFAAAQSFFGSWLGLLLLFGWSLAFFFHLCNGLRHLMWDTGYGLDLRTTYATGWVVVAASGTLTILAWIVGLAARS
jgi:succinate dehydrogenase / fumarate reductase cytochrome b subunit